MPFEKGNKLSKGRPQGSYNKLDWYAKQRIMSALKRISPEVLDMAVKDARPGEILSFLGKLAPKNVNTKVAGEVVNINMTKAQYKKMRKEMKDIDDV